MIPRQGLAGSPPSRCTSRRNRPVELIGVDLNPMSEPIARAATPVGVPIDYRTGNVFDPTVAASMRDIILAPGNSTDRAEAYRQFRGRDPDVNALLRVRGFPVPAQ